MTAAELDYERQNTLSVRVRAIDRYGLGFEDTFTIQVNDLPELDWNGFELLQDTNDNLIETTGVAKPEDFIAVGNRVFFTAEVPTKGRELFVTDGTGEGTRIVKDIAVGAVSTRFDSFCAR